MGTVKYSDTEILKDIQSRVFLLTNKSLTQQEILEKAVEVISDNIDLLLERIEPGARVFSEEEIEAVRKRAKHWGQDTSNLSSTVDETLYG